MRKLWWTLPAAALAMGCGEELTPDPSVEINRTIHSIYGGSPPDAPEHGAVVGIHQRSGNQVSVSPYCTGTLITDDVILTAAHCLDEARGGKAFRTASPDTVAIYLGGENAQTDADPIFIGVTETLIHPSYDRNALRNDIALIRLSIDAPASIPRVPALPASLGFTAADIGDDLDFAGFGYAEDRSFGWLLHALNPLGGFGCSVSGCGSAGDAATQISYRQPTAGPCNGDSGGPAFITRGGTAYVGGITSYGDANCTVYGVSTRVDAFEGFIGAFAGNGGAGGSGGAGGDGGSGGGAGASCGDGVCDAGESCDGRAGTSACASDCDGRTGGNPNRRYCYVGGTCEGPGCP